MVSFVHLANDGVGNVVDGRFPLLRWLGGTDSSSVFLTEFEGDSPRKAAIKLIPAAGIDADARVAQWVTAKNLSHPHLLRVFHAGRCAIDGEDYIYVVTEYADEVLSEILAARPLSPEETAEMLSPVLDALSWLHARDLVHGHLHPSNILVVDESLKISIDRLHNDGEFGRPALLSGQFDAPEMATGLLSPATDIWSVGVVVVQCLFRHPLAWNGPRGQEPVVPATIPEPFFSIARRCLHVDPARRSTLDDIRTALDPAKVAKPAPAKTAAKASSPRHIPTSVLAGAAVVLGGVIGAFIAFSHHNQPPSAESQMPAAQTSEPAPAAVEPQPPATEATSPQASTPKAAAPEPPPPQTQIPASPQQESPQSASPAPSAPAPDAAPLQHSGATGAVASRPTPDIPQHILDTVHGHVRVRVRVDVDAQGKITNAVLDDPGPSRYFADKALATARNWTFTPAHSNGQAVPSTWMLHFSFGHDGSTVTSTETAP
ncbi:MAG TPA: TonB family protein [Acidobacteriaceae bacterium]|nr:TonB family protein [Acidobacteriaceae bacterium]